MDGILTFRGRDLGGLLGTGRTGRHFLGTESPAFVMLTTWSTVSSIVGVC